MMVYEFLKPVFVSKNDFDDFYKLYKSIPEHKKESDWSMTTKPTIVCLCGSARFMEQFQKSNLEETMAGRIVLSIGAGSRSDDAAVLGEQKISHDELHKRKIDLCDEILVLNCFGYIGKSTRSEIDYAKKMQKRIRYLEPLKSVWEMARDLCDAIETRLGCSTESTNCSTAACALADKIRAVEGKM